MPEKPNVILILADDLGFSDLGFMGSEIRTPNIDKLATEGLSFSAMYNCARCCPTRASLLTGLYPHKAGIGHMVASYGTPAYSGCLLNSTVTIAEALRISGYRTLMSGKWHVGGKYRPREADRWTPGDIGHPTPRQRGFDRFFGTLDGSGSFFYPHYIAEDDHRIFVTTDDFYMTDAISDNAVKMIDEALGTDDKPFFLYLAYTAPHWPLHARSEDIARYDGVYRKGWDHCRASRHEEMLSKGLLQGNWRMSPRDPNSHPWQDAKYQEWEAMRMAAYAAMVDRMDQGIGRVLSALRRSGADENTLILFLSDNGGCAEFLAEDGWVEDYPAPVGKVVLGGNRSDVLPGSGLSFMTYDLPWSNVSNAPFRLHKCWVHEGGISTPLVAHWPKGIAAPAIIHQARHVVDIMPTILEVAGAPYPKEFGGYQIQSLDGESMVPLFYGSTAKREQPIFWEHEGNSAIRLGDWKLVREHGKDWELYNMEEDRTELNDLRHGSKSLASELIAEYRGWAERVGVLDWETVRAHPLMDWHQEHKPKD